MQRWRASSSRRKLSRLLETCGCGLEKVACAGEGLLALEQTSKSWQIRQDCYRNLNYFSGDRWLKCLTSSLLSQGCTMQTKITCICHANVGFVHDFVTLACSGILGLPAQVLCWANVLFFPCIFPFFPREAKQQNNLRSSQQRSYKREILYARVFSLVGSHWGCNYYYYYFKMHLVWWQ